MILADSQSRRSSPSFAVTAAEDAARIKALQQVAFTISAAEFTQLPADSATEVAFAGRSNAGKSSAINTICQRRRLAFVSKEPGRTQLLNLFQVAPGRYLVDLPGYGYARVPAAIKDRWDAMVGGYLARRSPLKAVVLVVDVRRGLGELDRRLAEWLPPGAVDLHVLLAKSDKLSRSEASAVLRATRAELTKHPGSGTAQLFSSLSGEGAAEARARLCGWLDLAAGKTEAPELGNAEAPKAP